MPFTDRTFLKIRSSKQFQVIEEKKHQQFMVEGKGDGGIDQKLTTQYWICSKKDKKTERKTLKEVKEFQSRKCLLPYMCQK